MRQKQLPEERYQVKIEDTLSTQARFIDPFLGQQKIYDQIVQETSQMLNPK